jgi:dihydrofolate reductase
LARARDETRKDLWLFGGGTLNGSFLREGLVDELRITIVPRLLGEGIRIFEGAASESRLEAVQFTTWNNGAFQVTYKVDGQ